MSAATAGTMSVNGRQADISFASFLRDRMNHQPNAPFHQFRTTLGHPLPVQTINNSKLTCGGHSTPLFRQPAGQAPLSRHPHLAPGLSMNEQEQAYFKDYVRDPEDLYLSTNLVALPPAFHHYALTHSLYPGYGDQSSFGGSTPPFPLKTESSPPLPTPSILPRNVDVSRYENVSYEDWYKAPTLYESSSPSSAEYHSTSPATPDDVFSEYSFNVQSNPDMLGYATAGPDLSIVPGGVPGMPHRTNYTLSLVPNHAAPSMSYTLPPTDLLNTTPCGYPHYFHHHSIEGTRSLSQDLDPQKSPSSDDDLDEVSSSASSSSHGLVLAKENVAARQRRDKLLLQMRNEGLAYRDIKRLGRFKEAESTLRGRYRALTKDREDRVRKPQWQPDDVTLLRQAVRYYTHGVNKKLKMKYGRRKLPWKKISQRMLDHGSSYHFAPATCARKWEEVGISK